MTAVAGEAGRTGAAGEAYVFPLEALSRGRIDVAGGKAANLGELLTAGLPVPGGFCVTTEAYAVVASGAELTAVLEALAVTAANDASALERLAAEAREALLGAPVPEAVAGEVRERYASLGPDVAVAVRSSATAEDLPGASFAGQQETYLNVRGGEAVLEAVRRCWASLWTDRAVAYRARSGIDPRGVRLAVV
ncbi:MAG TPA: PEP/pyruvate-binding domain-containing protein, partial [Chloroflexota bacterium]|nr:PEP/pyruvate-binding domain-containing protein [Chloroflexota bacterium]